MTQIGIEKRHQLASSEDLQAARRQWRAVPTETDGQDPDFVMGVMASFTADPLTPFLGAKVLELGYARPEIVHADYNQIVQSCLDHRSGFDGHTPDAITILWRLDDLGETTDAHVLKDSAELILNAIETLRADFKGMIIIGMPPRPRSGVEGLVEFARPSEMISLWHAVGARLAELTQRLQNVYCVDLEAVIGSLGEEAAVDARKQLLYRQPFSERFYYLVAEKLARVVRARKLEPKKCLVLDCDNTLWGGIVGEDGVAGLAVGHDFPGSAFRQFQLQVKALKASGVLIALNSKNNSEEVWDVFDSHEGMVLRREDILSARLNWQSKSENLKAIAEELNIGLDALVFVDDNPFEIAEVERHAPEVVCLKVPEDVAFLPGLLADNSFLFDRLDVTEDDRSRVEMMRAEIDRRESAQAMNKEDFLATLELRVHIYPPSEIDLPRVAQLTNKTNQFNVTTRRYSLEDIAAFRDSGEHQLFCVSVADRFGDYGLVGVAILKVAGSAAEIDTLLMSCRVLGRGIETAMMASLAEAAVARGCSLLRGVYIPTRKNRLVADLFENHDFSAAGDVAIPSALDGATLWLKDLTAPIEIPAYLSVERGRPS